MEWNKESDSKPPDGMWFHPYSDNQQNLFPHIFDGKEHGTVIYWAFLPTPPKE